MNNIIHICCPKCNSQSLYKFGKDKFANQKYQCCNCKHQFAPARIRCCDKKCNHSFFYVKPTLKLPSSMSNIIGKEDFKRMRHSIHLIISALTMFYIGGSSFCKISLMIDMLYNVKVSHVTISSWCKKFAPIFHSKMLTLVPTINFNSDEWHADETVVKILDKKYYIWFIIDSETRFVLGFHLSPYRDYKQVFTLLNSVKSIGKPNSIVTHRYPAYKVTIKSVFNANHIPVKNFKDDISKYY